MKQQAYNDQSLWQHVSGAYYASSRTCLKYESARYMIFWGAPGHFKGGFGNVNIAFPSLKLFRAWKVFSTVSTE